MFARIVRVVWNHAEEMLKARDNLRQAMTGIDSWKVGLTLVAYYFTTSSACLVPFLTGLGLGVPAYWSKTRNIIILA